MKYIDRLPQTLHTDSLLQELEKKHLWVNQNKKGFLRYREPFLILDRFSAQYVSCDDDVVTIGRPDELEQQQRSIIFENLKAFMPWRKGPFSVFGTSIDAEWRSERKWQRVLPRLPDLHNKVIADIGCNNGYYMFRMAQYSPQFVLGFEPSVQHYYCFKALNSMAGFTNLEIDLLGVEHISLFPDTFDVIFLMGVIYHRSSPLKVLHDILTALKPGGTLLVESQAIPGNEPYALFPEKTYAKAPGTYFVPTGSCLINWMKRAGYSNTELFYSHPMSSDEQRKTEWMVFESYADYLDTNDPTKTIEGYPAPCRIFLKGEK